MSDNRGIADSTTERSRFPIWRSPLLRQIGGMALGAALVIALFATNGWLLKRAGKQLSQEFSERRTGGLSQPDLPYPVDASIPWPPIQTCDTARSQVCR